ncbi:MAG: DUF368 domain-containing protein [Balneolaceae bacterium]|nr:MAG: DUF368 domain-containing protein [Balneolaceae bacterium]
MKEKRSKPFIETYDLTRWREAPLMIFKGFLMGSADIVPGVSGGTMALITGIYDRLIFAIKSLNLEAVKSVLRLEPAGFFQTLHWKFILFLATGMALAVIFFTRVVPLQVYMFTHPEIVYGVFFGLILGSIGLLIAEIDSRDRNWKYSLGLAAGASFGYWVVTLVPSETPETFWFVFLAGSVSISAMILPGISGSYILLIFQKYDYILTLLSELGGSETVSAFLQLIPFLLGAVTGIIVFSRILSWLLKNFHSATIVVLIGFLIGSLYVIWPFQEREFAESVRSAEVLPADHPLAAQLLNQSEPTAGPQHYRISGFVETDPVTGEPVEVEIERVSRKLISNTPFFPWGSERLGGSIDKRGGFAGISAGLLLIFLIMFLRGRAVHRRKPEEPEKD